MCKKNLSNWVLGAFVFCVGLNTQVMGETSEYEEIIKKQIEEDTSYYRPKVPIYIGCLTKSKDWHEREGVASRLGKARDMRGLDVLKHALIHDERPIVRTNAATAIAQIEDYNNDTTALSVLREALDDSITDVRFHAANSLVFLGDKVSPMEVLRVLAEGEDIKKWSADWEGYMGLEHMTEEDIQEQKKKFRDGIRKRAITLLGMIGTEEAFSILNDVASKCSNENIQWGDKTLNVSEYAKQTLEKAKKGEFTWRPSLY